MEWLVLGVVAFVAIEVGFFALIYKMFHGAKRDREKEFALLDRDRAELLNLQEELLQTTRKADAATKDSLAKLNKIGAKAHLEWTEMTTKIEEVMVEIERRSQDLIDTSLKQLNRKKHEAAHLINEIEELRKLLGQDLQNAKKVLRFFDTKVDLDTALDDLRLDKYTEAKQLLNEGLQATEISRRLGLSLREVALVAHSLQ